MPVLRHRTALALFIFFVLPVSRAQQSAVDCSAADASRSLDCNRKKIGPRKEVLIVTGTFAPSPEEEVDRAVSVIEIKEDLLPGSHWTDALHQDPSIDLRQRAPNGVQGDLSIRGSSFGQTLILLNGLRMNDVQSGHHNLDLPLPTQALERIEVLHGGGSTLYGADAVGGSVNFITAPPKISEFRAGAAVGNFGTNQQSASAAWTTRRWDQMLSVGRDFSTGFRPDRDYRNFSALSQTGLQTSLGRTMVMLGFADKPFGADQFYGNFNSWERTKSWLAALKQDLGESTEFDLGYRRHSDEFILFRDRPEVFENNHVSESWQAALRRKQPLGQNSALYYGGEGFHESIDSNNLGQHSRNRGAGYVDYDVRVLRRFSFSLGAREEIFGSAQGDTTEAEFSPTLAGGFWIKEGLKVKGSASRAFRLPTYTDLYYHDPANVGNPDLKPETAWDYEGGLLWDRGGRLRAEGTLFHRREKNDIDYVRSSAADIYHAANIQSLNFTGVEAMLEVRLPRRQRLQFAYTGLHGAQDALNGLQSKYVFNYPVHDGLISWQGVLPRNLIVRSRVGVVSRFERDPYAVWDTALAKEFEHIAAHLGFSNLTDTQYEEIQGVAMPGRGVVFGVEFILRSR